MVPLDTPITSSYWLSMITMSIIYLQRFGSNFEPCAPNYLALIVAFDTAASL